MDSVCCIYFVSGAQVFLVIENGYLLNVFPEMHSTHLGMFSREYILLCHIVCHFGLFLLSLVFMFHWCTRCNLLYFISLYFGGPFEQALYMRYCYAFRIYQI